MTPVRIARLRAADLEAIVALVNDRASRSRMTSTQRIIRALAVRELRRREAVTEDALAILRGLRN